MAIVQQISDGHKPTASSRLAMASSRQPQADDLNQISYGLKQTASSSSLNQISDGLKEIGDGLKQTTSIR